MLADPNKEIRSQTYSVLEEFLREIRDADTVSYAPIIHVLVQHSASVDKFSRFTAINWLHTLVAHGREQLLPFCAQVLNAVGSSSVAHARDHEITPLTTTPLTRHSPPPTTHASRPCCRDRRPRARTHAAQFASVHTLMHAHTHIIRTPRLHPRRHSRSLRSGGFTCSCESAASRVMQLSAQIWPALFNCLSNPSEEVVRPRHRGPRHMASSTQQVSQPHNAAVSSSTTTTHHHNPLTTHPPVLSRRAAFRPVIRAFIAPLPRGAAFVFAAGTPAS